MGRKDLEKTMRVVGFVGVSGSGKSYRALEVAADEGIRYIIDDGLLISDHRIIAGKSAKKESTRLASVRSALFLKGERAKEMMTAINQHNPQAILILGTSTGMIDKIATVLSLPNPEKYIKITDIATSVEIEKAIETRKNQGKHVIPVPTFEIKKDFSGYWMDALKKLRKNKKSGADLSEKSVVRPTFSYLGEFVIANSVLIGICTYEAKLTEDVSEVVSCSVISDEEESVNIKIGIVARYGKHLPDVAKKVTNNIRKAFEKTTAININLITVTIKGLSDLPLRKD